jgi:ketosteroid isomerase-like protein
VHGHRTRGSASRERSWLAAILAKNLVLLESFLAEEFVYTASNHGRRTRQEWLDSIADYQFADLQLLETSVTSYGDVALVHARIRQDATLAGQVRVGVFLITDVWVKREGSWQVVSRTSVSES